MKPEGRRDDIVATHKGGYFSSLHNGGPAAATPAQRRPCRRHAWRTP
jgi:hypothetical protein